MVTTNEPTQGLNIKLNSNLAWYIREKVPGPFALSTVDPAYQLLYNFRSKIDNAILRIIDEDVEEVEVYITPREAWIMDSVIKYDGEDGPGTGLLVSMFRGLWGLDMDLPSNVAEEPDWDKSALADFLLFHQGNQG